MAVSTRTLKTRAIVQWSLLPLVFITIGLGWKWPLIGFVVPAVMIMGIVGGVTNGRYVCGNLCPRGAFFDRIMPHASPARRIPPLMRLGAFRWTVFAALMGFMIWRLSSNIADPYHWGRVFWLMCTVTTAAGVLLAFFIHPRSWCSICPVGTAGNALGGHRNQIKIDSAACRECRLCEKVCPMNLEIVKDKAKGVLTDRDCLRCSECVVKCPVKALRYPGEAA